MQTVGTDFRWCVRAGEEPLESAMLQGVRLGGELDRGEVSWLLVEPTRALGMTNVGK